MSIGSNSPFASGLLSSCRQEFNRYGSVPRYLLLHHLSLAKLESTLLMLQMPLKTHRYIELAKIDFLLTFSRQEGL